MQIVIGAYYNAIERGDQVFADKLKRAIDARDIDAGIALVQSIPKAGA